MNMLDLATYLPKLGRLTASLANAADVDAREFSARNRGKRNTSKQAKKDGAVMIVKKPTVTSHPNAYRSNQWTRSQSPTKKQKASIVLSKARKASQQQKKKSSNRPASRPPEKLIKPTAEKSDVENTKDIRLIQDAIDEFKTQRDQFVHSLGGLQRKLIKFRIPNLFSSTVTLDKLADKVKPSSPTETTFNDTPKEKPKEKKSRTKEVRSVSQHFYLADMTESESTSSSSSSSDGSQEDDTSEIELAKRKVNKFLDYDLIPIQPPDNRRPEKTNSLVNQGRKTAPKKTLLNAQLTQLRKGVSEMAKKIPTKAEASKQKAAQEAQRNNDAPAKPESWSQPLSPKTRAAVTSEFKKLKKASELKLRNKLKKTVTNITLPQ